MRIIITKRTLTFFTLTKAMPLLVTKIVEVFF